MNTYPPPITFAFYILVKRNKWSTQYTLVTTTLQLTATIVQEVSSALTITQHNFGLARFGSLFGLYPKYLGFWKTVLRTELKMIKWYEPSLLSSSVSLVTEVGDLMWSLILLLIWAEDKPSDSLKSVSSEKKPLHEGYITIHNFLNHIYKNYYFNDENNISAWISNGLIRFC